MTATDGIDDWFAARGWTIFPFQREAWQAYDEGASGLIHSPTGSGKSLAAWVGPLRQIAAGGPRGSLRVLWLTPLRALANDTAASLNEIAAASGVADAVRVRTGDTPASERKRQRTAPPPALVTTPESLSLLLSYADGARQFRHLDAVIVDEWHELLGTKRGVQLELCLARLRHLAPGLRVWGLSATLGNLQQALAVLLGPSGGGRLIAGEQPKTTRIRSALPPAIERFPWAGHLGVALLDQVVAALEHAATTLLFTNTRSQAELWFEALTRARPDWLGAVALHHGSIDRGLRREIEARLKRGDLRCVVCTSSLDLGVDFAPVDQVLQVGSPKGVARLAQRAGRSGHQPGAVSDILCVPGQALELLEIAAARRALAAGRIEAREPLTLCLDVLAQHLVTIALGSGFREREMFDEVRRTHAFAELGAAEWRWLLDFVTRGGRALQGYPQYRKVVPVDGDYRVPDRRIARMHRMSVGTIASDTTMNVRWLSGGALGRIEEAFVARLARGDRFLFAGRLVELVMIRDMTAYVRRARGSKRAVPRWQGGRMPLSSELAASIVALLDAYRNGDRAEPELAAVADLLDLQAAWSRLPAGDELLAEFTRTREGHSLFVYPFQGRLVHEGLAALVAYRIGRERPATLTLSVNDYGFELLSAEALPADADALRRWLSPQALADDLLACINESEFARRQFRDIARIAGLVFAGYPGSAKSARQIQASSSLIFDVLQRYDADNLLLRQAHREVLERQLEYRRMHAALAALAARTIVLSAPERLSPLAFPLWAERLQSQTMSSESWRERVLKMAARLERHAAAAPRRRRA